MSEKNGSGQKRRLQIIQPALLESSIPVVCRYNDFIFCAFYYLDFSASLVEKIKAVSVLLINTNFLISQVSKKTQIVFLTSQGKFVVVTDTSGTENSSSNTKAAQKSAKNPPTQTKNDAQFDNIVFNLTPEDTPNIKGKGEVHLTIKLIHSLNLFV